MARHFITALLVLQVCVPVMGQISKPGSPLGHQAAWLETELVFERMPQPDVLSLMSEDEVTDTIYDIPWRFGENIPVNLNPDNAGRWSYATDGSRVWHLGIASPGAYSLNLTFDMYHLPPGAQMYVYNTDRSFVLGAFTDFNNQDDGYFATTLVPGDSIVIEYIEPPDVDFGGNLNLATVTHAYRDPAGFTKAFGQSGWCNLNVACDEALGWEDQISSVVMLLVGSNGFCSGVMINNTNNDARPFLLSANHCYRNPSTLVVWFNWESETCGNPTISPPYDAMSGAVNRARNIQSDFWLLELNHRVPDDYGPYFSGWNRTLAEVLTDTVVGIHHPRGDIKKFSYAEGGVQASRYLGGAGSGTTHWRITWDGGTTTEPASSGSPIFDGQGRIIGQLHGGYAACGNTEPDWYGRFGISWSGGGQPDNSLSHWLDPFGMNPEDISGFDPFLKQPQDILAIDAYQDDGGDVIVTWTPNEHKDMVLLAWNTDEDFGQAAGFYSVGDTVIGGGQIIYMGFDQEFRLQETDDGLTYYFRAWSVQQGPYYSPGQQTELTASCPSFYVLPFDEPFTGYSLPGCWTQYYDTGEVNWQLVDSDNHPLDSTVSGNYSLVFKHIDAAATTILASPWLSGGDFDLLKLSFHYANLHHEEGQDELSLLFRQAGEDEWTVIKHFSADTRSWTLVDLEWPLSEKGSFQFAFEGEAGGGSGVFVDAVLAEGLYETEFHPPTRLLVAEKGIDRLTLVWEKPEPGLHGNDKGYNPELTAYIVYRDGKPLGMVNDQDMLQFEDKGLAVGAYEYYVTAKYIHPTWESEPSNTITAGIEEVAGLTLNASVSGPGNIYPQPGEYLFNTGAEVYFSATPDPFAGFEAWMVAGEVYSSHHEINFNMLVSKDLQAVFNQVNRKLVLESSPHESGVQTGGGEYAHGSWVDVATSIPENWDFLYWSKGEQIISTRPVFRYRVEDNDTLKAVFSPPLQQISARAEPVWAGYVLGAGFFPYGTEARLEAVEDNDRNYVFSHWEEGGLVIHEDPVYVFSVSGPRFLTAKFEEKLYALEVRVSPEGAGLTTPEKGIHHYPLNDRVELIAIPASGWTMSHWEFDGEIRYGKFLEINIRKVNPPVTAHFEVITSTEPAEPSPGRLQLYPNPTRDHLHVEWIGTGHTAELQLLDTGGQIMLQESLPPLSGLRQYVLALGSFPPGVYILRLTDGKQIYMARIIVY